MELAEFYNSPWANVFDVTSNDQSQWDTTIEQDELPHIDAILDFAGINPFGMTALQQSKVADAINSKLSNVSSVDELLAAIQDIVNSIQIVAESAGPEDTNNDGVFTDELVDELVTAIGTPLRDDENLEAENTILSSLGFGIQQHNNNGNTFYSWQDPNNPNSETIFFDIDDEGNFFQTDTEGLTLEDENGNPIILGDDHAAVKSFKASEEAIVELTINTEHNGDIETYKSSAHYKDLVERFGILPPTQ